MRPHFQWFPPLVKRLSTLALHILDIRPVVVSFTRLSRGRSKNYDQTGRSRSPVGQRGEVMPSFGVTYSGGPMERILVVEDDRAVQKALKRLFEAEGFAVEISADGKSALEAYRAATPSAVVLDLRLPAMSGRDVCREIKQQAPALPVIILSAASDVSDKVLLLELGADDYVTKPFSPRELLARVRAALRRRRGRVRPRSMHSTASRWISPRWKLCAKGSPSHSRPRNSRPSNS